MRKLSLIPLLFLVLGSVGGLFIVSLFVLRLTGDIRPFKVPTGGMMPALSPGDQFFMDGLSYRFRQPRRHEILAFTTSGIAGIRGAQTQPAPIFIQRAIGLPGDHLELRYKELYINGEKDPFYAGRNFEVTAAMRYLEGFHPEVTVPADSYFVVGDNLPNSYDSRYWGFLARRNVLGRVLIRYAPLTRIGFP